MAFGKGKNGKNVPVTDEVNNEFVDPEEIDPFLEQKKTEETASEVTEELAADAADTAADAAETAEEAVADAADTEMEMTDFADEGLKDPADDFEFVSEETVLDKTMTAEPTEVEKGTPRAKTDRRNADTTDRKRAKNARRRRRRGPTIIVIIIIIAILAFIGYKYYEHKTDEKKAEEAAIEQQEQEELVVDENVSALITNYYSACASGETEALDAYAESITDLEEDLIKTKSQYVESYNDILCQRADGPEEDSYLVTVTDNLKFAETDIQHPEVAVFYIKKNADGIYLIENAYSEFNRTYHVTATDPEVERAINEYIESDAFKALQAEAASQEETAAADATYAAAKKAMDDAVAKWLTDNDAAIKSAAAAVAGGAAADAATVDASAEADAAATDAAVEEGTEATDEAAAEPEEAAVEEQTEDLPDTVYATEAVRIRTEQDMEADYVTTVYPGDPLDVVGYTDGWYHVKSGDNEGYVNEEYVSLSQD